MGHGQACSTPGTGRACRKASTGRSSASTSCRVQKNLGGVDSGTTAIRAVRSGNLLTSRLEVVYVGPVPGPKGVNITTTEPDAGRAWTIAEAKARLSEILRLAEEEGPQQIGRRNTFVVVPMREWERRSAPRKPLGQWLVENMPRGIELELPDRKNEPEREIPFQTDEWD